MLILRLGSRLGLGLELGLGLVGSEWCVCRESTVRKEQLDLDRPPHYVSHVRRTKHDELHDKFCTMDSAR